MIIGQGINNVILDDVMMTAMYETYISPGGMEVVLLPVLGNGRRQRGCRNAMGLCLLGSMPYFWMGGMKTWIIILQDCVVIRRWIIGQTV